MNLKLNISRKVTSRLSGEFDILTLFFEILFQVLLNASSSGVTQGACSVANGLALRRVVGVVLERVVADEVDVGEEVVDRLVLAQVDLRHHRRHVHRVCNDLVIIGNLENMYRSNFKKDTSFAQEFALILRLLHRPASRRG